MKGYWTALVITIIFGVFTTTTSSPVNITVMYESLCPDSMRFIVAQLQPTYKILKEYVNVEFVPFGKASYTKFPWSATCQHGRHECMGNIRQACALQKYVDNEMQVNFIGCVMSQNFPPSMGFHCAKMLNYNYEGVDECARGEEGRKLFMYYGERTRQFKNRLSFVPTIALNNVYNDETQKKALQDLKSVVCDNLRSLSVSACQ